jgi:hypothetical protein
MTVVIKDNNGSFRDKALGWAGCPIDTTGLEIAHFFGGTLDNSLRNFSYGKPVSAGVGVPTINPNSVSLKGATNYVQSAMADANEMTLLVAFKPVEAVASIPVGNLVSTTDGTTRKVAIAYSSNMLVSAFRGTDTNGAGATTPTALVVGAPVCLALRNSIGAGADVILNNLTKGEVGKQANLGTPSLGSPMRIGGGYNSASYVGKTEVYAVLGFNRKLTDVELATLYAWLKAYCARRSIVI